MTDKHRWVQMATQIGYSRVQGDTETGDQTGMHKQTDIQISVPREGERY